MGTLRASGRYVFYDAAGTFVKTQSFRAENAATAPFTGKGSVVYSAELPTAQADATYRPWQILFAVNTSSNRAGEPHNPIAFVGFLPTDRPFVYDCWEQAYRPPSPSTDVWPERWWAYGNGKGHEQRAFYSRYESQQGTYGNIIAAYTTDLWQIVDHQAVSSGVGVTNRVLVNVSGSVFDGRMVVNAIPGAGAAPFSVFNESAQLVVQAQNGGSVFGGAFVFRDLTGARQSLIFEQNAVSSAATYSANHASYYLANNQTIFNQRNGTNTGYLPLPYIDNSNRTVVGSNGGGFNTVLTGPLRAVDGANGVVLAKYSGAYNGIWVSSNPDAGGQFSLVGNNNELILNAPVAVGVRVNTGANLITATANTVTVATSGGAAVFGPAGGPTLAVTGAAGGKPVARLLDETATAGVDVGQSANMIWYATGVDGIDVYRATAGQVAAGLSPNTKDAANGYLQFSVYSEVTAGYQSGVQIFATDTTARVGIGGSPVTDATATVAQAEAGRAGLAVVAKAAATKALFDARASNGTTTVADVGPTGIIRAVATTTPVTLAEYPGSSAYSGIWLGQTPNTTGFSLLGNAGETYLNGPGNLYVKVNNGAAAIQVNATGLGFFAATPVARPTVTGKWNDGSAGVSLAAALASLGLVTNSTTPN
jgi:hypothetical protein